MVDDLDLAALRLVDAALIGEAVESERRIALQMVRDREHIVRPDANSRVTCRLEGGDRAGEARDERLVYRGGVHDRRIQARVPTGSPRTSHFSPIIFSCRSRMPWVSASGRGGHPGTYTSTGSTLSTPSHTEYAS